MSITWANLSTATETSGDFSLTTTIKKASTGSGYLLRIDRETTYKGKALPVGLERSIVFADAAVPASIDWTEQSSETVTDGDIQVIDKTFSGIPKDGGGDPIGTGKFWRHETTFYYTGMPGVGAKIVLSWQP